MREIRILFTNYNPSNLIETPKKPLAYFSAVFFFLEICLSVCQISIDYNAFHLCTKMNATKTTTVHCNIWHLRLIYTIQIENKAKSGTINKIKLNRSGILCSSKKERNDATRSETKTTITPLHGPKSTEIACISIVPECSVDVQSKCQTV